MCDIKCNCSFVYFFFSIWYVCSCLVLFLIASPILTVLIASAISHPYRCDHCLCAGNRACHCTNTLRTWLATQRSLCCPCPRSTSSTAENTQGTRLLSRSVLRVINAWNALAFRTMLCLITRRIRRHQWRRARRECTCCPGQMPYSTSSTAENMRGSCLLSMSVLCLITHRIQRHQRQRTRQERVWFLGQFFASPLAVLAHLSRHSCCSICLALVLVCPLTPYRLHLHGNHAKLLGIHNRTSCPCLNKERAAVDC